MNPSLHARPWLVAPTIAAALTVCVVASARLAKTGSSTAGFEARGPAGLGIHGTTSEVVLADDGATVTVTVPLGRIGTGISLRDEHMRRALEVDAYPNAELRVARSALRFPASGAESSGDARGVMRIRGVSRDVSFRYRARRDGARIDVRGTARIDMTDFGIKPPSYAGVSVKPDVEVLAEFQATDG